MINFFKYKQIFFPSFVSMSFNYNAYTYVVESWYWEILNKGKINVFVTFL